MHRNKLLCNSGTLISNHQNIGIVYLTWSCCSPLSFRTISIKSLIYFGGIFVSSVQSFWSSAAWMADNPFCSALFHPWSLQVEHASVNAPNWGKSDSLRTSLHWHVTPLGGGNKAASDPAASHYSEIFSCNHGSPIPASWELRKRDGKQPECVPFFLIPGINKLIHRCIYFCACFVTK